jgi:hypothetical protein
MTMRRRTILIVAVLAAASAPIACQLFEPNVVPADAWNRARPSIVAILDRVAAYRDAAGSDAAPVRAVRDEIAAHDGTVGDPTIRAWDAVLRPLLAEHDAAVAADSSLTSMRRKVYLRESDETGRWLDSALERVTYAPGGGS